MCFAGTGTLAIENVSELYLTANDFYCIVYNIFIIRLLVFSLLLCVVFLPSDQRMTDIDSGLGHTII